MYHVYKIKCQALRINHEILGICRSASFNVQRYLLRRGVTDIHQNSRRHAIRAKRCHCIRDKANGVVI